MKQLSVLRPLHQLITSLMLTLGVLATALADDIDVYTAQLATQQKPNILFVLDYSGSMGSGISGSNLTRLEALKQAMDQLLERNLDRINAGIGSLYSSSTTGIRWPISELNADANSIDPDIPAGQFTVRDVIKRLVDERNAGGSTSTVDALVEAAQYFRGDPVTHNDADPTRSNRHRPHRWSTTANTYQGGNRSAALATTYSPSNGYSQDTSGTFYCNDYSGSGGPNYCEGKSLLTCEPRVPTDDVTDGYERLTNLWGNYQRCEYRRFLIWEGARYNSPITQPCQTNTIVLISDGEPTSRNAGASLRSVIGRDPSSCQSISFANSDQWAAAYAETGVCGIEVLETLSSNDVMPEIPDSKVRTFTVGFNITGNGQAYLQQLARAGDGEYYQANQPEELSEALNSIVDEVVTTSENFAELSVDVDKATFSNSNRAYFSLFAPSRKNSWQGNLKGYFIGDNGLEDINGNPAVVVTADGLQFAETAQSFWSANADGNDVTLGGASAKLLNASRNLYTYTADTLPANGVALAVDSAHRLSSSNSTLTSELLGGTDKRNEILDWIQDAPMGDPLHTKSVTINYGNQQVVYISTNQGLLHAFDATRPRSAGAGDTSGGDEIFAFMPRRLLKNLPALYEGSSTQGHIYGLDGGITRWHDDTNNDGVVNGGEDVLLIVGMRRGGTAYYALDVSNPTAPELEWIIDDQNPDFPELAQSWSRMSLINVNDNGNTRKVLAFAAGYDAGAQDDVNDAVVSRGNAIYMIDKQGRLLWKAGAQQNADMRYSIPSDLTAIDSDGDYIADRIYVGDMAGQVWRIDFPDIRRTPKVTRLADLNDGQHQPIFYPPSVALNHSPKGKFLSVTVGTGNRTDPLLQGNTNYLYMIRDTNLAKGEPGNSFTTVKSLDLYDASNNNIASTDTATAEAAYDSLMAARGWKVALRPGEKSLSAITTFEGKILATTFAANLDNLDDVCGGGLDTTGRFYSLRVSDAQPVLFDADNDSSDRRQTRDEELQGDGIPSTPVVIFSQFDGNVQVIVDKQSVGSYEQSIDSLFWHAR